MDDPKSALSGRAIHILATAGTKSMREGGIGRRLGTRLRGALAPQASGRITIASISIEIRSEVLCGTRDCVSR
jgi:hypothetical protein